MVRRLAPVVELRAASHSTTAHKMLVLEAFALGCHGPRDTLMTLSRIELLLLDAHTLIQHPLTLIVSKDSLRPWVLSP
jgi:hypothetical protein